MPAVRNVGNRAIIRAIYDLHNVGWPTIPEIAAYLHATEESVKRGLLSLRDERIMRDRHRAGARQWMPWSAP